MDTPQAQEWYLLDRNTLEPIGPFSKEEILAKLQRGDVRIDEHIWGSHFGESNWVRIYELPEFRPAQVEAPRIAPPKRSKGQGNPENAVKLDFSKKEGEYGSFNAYRRFPRAPISAEVIVRDQTKYRRGFTADISENGVFVRLDDAETFGKGEEVIVTVRNAPGIGTFSVPGAVARVVNTGEVRGFGITFLRLNPRIRRKIIRFIVERLRAPEKGAA